MYKQQATLILLLIATSLLTAQTTASFENAGLNPGEYLNGSDGSGGFESGNVFLPNDYNEAFMAWEGWALSAVTDNETPGFNNQYSAITAGGFDGSTTYAVTYCFDGSVLQLQGEATGGVVEGLYVTNNTYPYFSMLDGDAFSKKFGGETGDDPDFFLLTVQKYLDGALGAEKVEFYLADYRFSDNSQDYIVDEWTYLDLSPLGNADSLLFTLSSSDVGQFGMNTPAYFCIDQVITADEPTAVKEPDTKLDLSIFPNPATNYLQLDLPGRETGEALILDLSGKLQSHYLLQPGINTLPLQDLSSGAYLLKVQISQQTNSQFFIKK